jgi:hypothetical protein
MRLAVMQPYFFPYLGYWQLIRSVDRFVIFDDVNYKVRGWINRNRILVNSEPTYVTVPLSQASQNKLISQISLDPSPWRGKLLRTIEGAYSSAPCFQEVFPLIESLVQHEADNLSAYLAFQLQALSMSLGLTAQFVLSSRRYADSGLSGQARVIDICKQEGATQYWNLPGGRDLYDAVRFADAGIDLRFISSGDQPYPQRGPGYVPGLSVIDMLMELGPGEVGRRLQAGGASSQPA